MRRSLVVSLLVSLVAPGCQSKTSDDKAEPPATPTTATRSPEGASPNEAAILRLEAAIKTRYSHRDRLGVSWDAELEKHRPALEAAASPAELGLAVAAVLTAAKDIHISVSTKGGVLPISTHQAQLAFNFDRARSLSAVKNVEHLDKCVATGQLADGIGYLLLASFSRTDCPRFGASLDTAWATVSGARALVIDVRPNTGGDENLARRVAARFITRDLFYARHENGAPPPAERPAKVHRRRLMAAMPRQRFTGPVALLIGPGNMSSAEAFILMMMQAPSTTTIGATTYGSSGNPKMFELGGGVSVSLPSWRAYQLDGSPLEGVGIEPALKVEWAASGDPVLAAAIAHLGPADQGP